MLPVHPAARDRACSPCAACTAASITLRILDEAAHVVGAMLGGGDGRRSRSSALHLRRRRATPSSLARVWVFGDRSTSPAAGSCSASRQRRARAERVVGKPTLIVGAGRIGAQVERRLDEQPELGLRPVGYVDAHPPPDEQVPGRRVPVLGGPDDLAGDRRAAPAPSTWCWPSSPRAARTPRSCRSCASATSSGSRCRSCRACSRAINVRVGLEHIGGMPLFRLRAVRPEGLAVRRQARARPRRGRVMLLVLLAPMLIAAHGRGEALLARPDLLPPAPRGPRRARLRPAQVPLDAAADARAAPDNGHGARCPGTRPPAASRARTGAPPSAS